MISAVDLLLPVDLLKWQQARLNSLLYR